MMSYNVLQHLPKLTPVEEGVADALPIMSNDTAHSPCVLQELEYIPAATVDNIAFDEAHRKRYAADGSYLEFPEESGNQANSALMHYEANMASWRELCNWFDYLRENGVWDNTRIIIASDHGHALRHYPDLVIQMDKGDKTEEQDLLMVKDFNSSEFKVDDTLMTNAYVPAFATNGIIDNPTNPFTGSLIKLGDKQDGVNLLFSYDWDILTNNGNTFLPGDWFKVEDNIYDRENWEYLGNY